MSLQKITTNMWCTGNAEEVGEFYADVFGDVAPGGASSSVESRYPDGPGLLEFQQPLAGRPLPVEVLIGGTRVILINAGPEDMALIGIERRCACQRIVCLGHVLLLALL